MGIGDRPLTVPDDLARKGRHPPISPGWRVWMLSLAVAAIDAIWFSFSDVTMGWAALLFPAVIGTACIGWYCAGYFVRLGDGPRLLAISFAFIWISHKSTAVLGQLIMTVPFTMADPLLAGWDRAVGLDWMGYLFWVTSMPWLAQALVWVYYAIIPASLLAFFVLHFSSRRERVSEYLAFSFVAAIIATIVGTAFPALGAVTYFQVPPALMAAFPDQTGAQWVQRLIELRSGLPVDVSMPIGLVSFPSYHVALTMIIAWSFRGSPIMFAIAAIFAIATAASAPIIGGHYFVDLISGAALVVIMIFAGRVAARRKSLRSRGPLTASAG